MQKTSIEWTGTYRPDGTLEPGFTANPIKYRDAAGNVVWGCVKTSPGCNHCYAEALAHRYGRGGPFKQSVMEGLTPFADEKELKAMLTYKPASGKRCFIGDMTDIFGEWVPDEMLNQLFRAMIERTDVTWQVLTKRAKRMQKYCGDRWGTFGAGEFPPARNIWLGVSVEDQQRADERIPFLLQTPAAVRFLSCEPLLSDIDIGLWKATCTCCSKRNNRWVRTACKIRADAFCGIDAETKYLPPGVVARANSNRHGALDINGLGIKPDEVEFLGDLHWCIVGGESGPGSRPMQVQWARDLVKQCRDAGVACFVKQLGSKPEGDTFPEDERDPVTGNRILHVRQVVTISGKGGNPEEWPADLRVREFPTVSA